MAVKIERGCIRFSLNTQALILFCTQISEVMIGRGFLLLLHYFCRRSQIDVGEDFFVIKVWNAMVRLLKFSN